MARHQAPTYFLIVILAVGLVIQSAAQQVSPALLKAAQEAYQQQQREQPQILARVKVDPKLVGKKVIVYTRDGKVLKGKLVQLGSDSMRLRIPSEDRIEELPLNNIAWVERQPASSKPALTVLAVVATIAIIYVVGVALQD